MAEVKRKSERPRHRDMVTSLRLSKAEHAMLKRVADRENRSISGQIRHIIEQLDAQEKTAA